MTNNVYILDSSSLIELNKHHAMDVFVSVWNNILQKMEEIEYVNGKFYAVKK